VSTDSLAERPLGVSTPAVANTSARPVAQITAVLLDRETEDSHGLWDQVYGVQDLAGDTAMTEADESNLSSSPSPPPTPVRLRTRSLVKVGRHPSLKE
jgi:hypothetical protein